MMAAERRILTGYAGAMDMDRERQALHQQLNELRLQHRDLDAAISSLEDSAGSDSLQLRRLKKQKLLLKDQIAQLEDRLFPDIIA